MERCPSNFVKLSRGKPGLGNSYQEQPAEWRLVGRSVLCFLPETKLHCNERVAEVQSRLTERGAWVLQSELMQFENEVSTTAR